MTKRTDSDETKRLIEEDPDFILSTKYKNSVEVFLKKKPDGTDSSTVAKLLGLKNSEEVERLYKESVLLLRKSLKIDSDE